MLWGERRQEANAGGILQEIPAVPDTAGPGLLRMPGLAQTAGARELHTLQAPETDEGEGIGCHT